MNSPDDLTPVQEIDGLLLKRDDLYAPFGPGEVNGGKLRQCMMLIDSLAEPPARLITYCSIHSPQAPITAACALSRGIPSIVIYGGTNSESVSRLPMPRLAMKYGAHIVIAAKSGRHAILHAKARDMAQPGDFIVQYGINIIGRGDVLLEAVAAQAQNLPDSLKHLVITCGSGITAAGLMIGLHRYGKKVERVHLVATAPDRRKLIHDTLENHGAAREFEYHDLFHLPGFVYEKGFRASWGGASATP